MLTRLKAFLSAALVLAVGGFALAQSVIITGTMSEYKNSIFQVGVLRVTREEGITAFAGGGQTGAYQLTYGLNRITTVASGNDSVKLPVCAGGKIVIVINAAASNSANVYAQTGDTINAIAANSPFALAANKMAIFACANDGNWYSVLTA